MTIHLQARESDSLRLISESLTSVVVFCHRSLVLKLDYHNPLFIQDTGERLQLDL